MPFKVIIAGSRDFNNYHLLCEKLDKILINKEDIEIVSGTASSADKMGEKYAKERGYKITQFPAKWREHGKSAGYKRNEVMAKYSDACICFWNLKSKGTNHMINLANQYQLPLRLILF